MVDARALAGPMSWRKILAVVFSVGIRPCTGAILVLLPLAMALYTYAINPEYFKPMLETEGGRSALMVAGTMQVIGMFVVRKIVAIKV